jgi:hypothetical protein
MTSQPDSKNISHKQLFKLKFISGLLGSAASVIICSPLDVIKVRLQVSHDKTMENYQKLTEVIKNTYKKEKIKGFYKGVKTGISTSPIFYSIFFPVYENMKIVYSKYFYKNQTTQNVKVLSLSSLTALLISDLLTTPLWVVKIRNQTQFLYDQNMNTKESFNIFKQIISLYKKEGFYSLYRGYKVSIITSPYIMIQFNIYEYISNFAKEISKSSTTPYRYVLVASIFSRSK